MYLTFHRLHWKTRYSKFKNRKYFNQLKFKPLYTPLSYWSPLNYYPRVIPTDFEPAYLKETPI